MRLISLTVRSYRIHRELTLSFDAARTLIGGPNESGKSTLAEAAHRALFLRSKTGGKLQKDMVSPHPGDPEVCLTFEACGGRWELEKRFAGARGSTRLTAAGGTMLKDDEAEAKLAEILRCDAAAGRANARDLAGAWAHLWVWQGKSGDDPASHASEHQDTLVQRLQQDGLAAVMQSPIDQQVRERVAAAYDEHFTAGGKVKAGSPIALARAAAEEAAAAVERAREIAERLEQAAETEQQAAREIAEADAALPQHREALASALATLEEVAKLREKETAARTTCVQADEHHQKLQDADTAIRALATRISTATAALQPAGETEAALAEKEAIARAADRSAEQIQRAAAEAVRGIRLRYDHAAAVVEVFEKSAAHRRLAEIAGEAGKLRQEISTHESALAKLPAVSAREVDRLRELDRSASRDAAALAAMAAGIEVLAAGLPITLDGEPLAAGEARVLSDTGELVLGNDTRIRIHPGGGGTLADARRKRDASQAALVTALEKLTLSDLDHAATVLRNRQALDQQLVGFRTRWHALGGETVSADLERAATALEAATAACERRAGGIPDVPSPADLEAAAALREDFRQSLSAAEAAESAARREADRVRAAWESAAAGLQRHRDRTAEARQALRDLETESKVLQAAHGEAAARESALAAARTACQAAREALAAAQSELKRLAPDLLEADVARFRRAIHLLESRRQEAHDRRVAARARLQLDGSADPQAELSHARARQAAAVDALGSAERHAGAIRRLHELFAECREAVDQALVQPFADRIAGYLQCLFGPGAAARVLLADSGIQGLELLRDGGSAFDFAALSGGAREQVAAAVRLAMAEILAADHDGALPIVFDDAFAFADPDRVQALQRMLDLAASRGLQVILLTCTPADYSAFGASEVRLGQRAD